MTLRHQADSAHVRRPRRIPPRVHSALAVGVLLGALAMTACSSPGDAGSPAEGVIGSWGSEEAGEPNLTFGQDGAVSGSDGCNHLAGNWVRTEDGRIATDNLATTLMACDDVDTWLSGIALAEVDGDRLVVTNAEGEQLGTLDRADD
jgi:heat shock protein HslJ